jgi:hypothetical protein
MNRAEHIRAQVRFLSEDDRITRMQLVEIIEAILTPYVDKKKEPKHFGPINAMIHRLVNVRDGEPPKGEDL